MVHVESVLPRDAIRSIDDPTFAQTHFGDVDDDVIVIKGADARAYPVRILSYHEIVNDVICGEPIAVTWCPICWSAVAYERTVEDRTLTFGTSGKLADDALLMYDRETESEWKQTTGEAIAGPLKGTQLTYRDSPMMTWNRFQKLHPEGVVLRGPESAAPRSDDELAAEYTMGPYDRYAQSERFGLYGMRGEGRQRTWNRTDIGPKTRVVGVVLADASRAYPLPEVATAGGFVTDHLGDRSLLVTHGDGHGQVFDDPGLEFEWSGDALRANGTTWDPMSGVSSDGRSLDRVPARRMFAFAWQDAHGADAFYLSGELYSPE